MLQRFKRNINWMITAPRLESAYLKWVQSGKTLPAPHFVKQKTLLEFSKKYNLKVLVETGTFLGEMVDAMKVFFDKVYSIELSPELHEKAKTRFNSIRNVELLQGDSSHVLEKILPHLDQPTLFWLDGHYSEGITARGEKDTPILEELTHIFNADKTNHVIIIDDARLFGSDPAYPSIAELSEFIQSKNTNLELNVKDDTIRITYS